MLFFPPMWNFSSQMTQLDCPLKFRNASVSLFVPICQHSWVSTFSETKTSGHNKACKPPDLSIGLLKILDMIDNLPSNLLRRSSFCHGTKSLLNMLYNFGEGRPASGFSANGLTSWAHTHIGGDHTVLLLTLLTHGPGTTLAPNNGLAIINTWCRVLIYNALAFGNVLLIMSQNT